MNKPPSVWVFNDGRTGTFNQALSVAVSLEVPFKIKEIKYNVFAKLPNFLRGISRLGIDKSCIFDINKDIYENDFPDIIINAGRRAAPFALYIQKMSGNSTKVVQIMNPGKFNLDKFSLLVIPYHDNFNFKGKNVLRILGAPHLVSQEKLREAAATWQDKFADLPRPYTALIVGGSTKNRTFTKEMAEELSLMVDKLMGESEKGSLLLTTSRRTGEENAEIIDSRFDCPKYVYKWGDKGENPYFGFLALADRIVVTGDSVSMCSEVCSTPVPVYIYDNKDLITEKHRRFLDSLYEKGYAEPLLYEKANDEAPHPVLDSSAEIAEVIKENVLK